MILVLSDIHVGRRGAHWREALHLMRDPKWEKIIICGDFFDLWYRPTVVLTLVLLFLSQDLAKKIVYVVGNHDEDIDDLLPTGELFQEVTTCYKMEIDGKRFIFVHGHETDFFNSRIPWFGHWLTWLQSIVHRVFKVDTHSLASNLIERLRIRQQRKKLMDRYFHSADVLISGHTHAPGYWSKTIWDEPREPHFLHHFNAGDWVRNKTYLTIDDRGTVLSGRL